MTIIIHFIFYIKYIFVQREIILDCFSFSCSGYDFTLIKKSHTLNYYLFLQIYFISFMSFSINKFKSHKFFTCKNFVFQFYIEKKISLQEMEVGLAPPSHCPKTWSNFHYSKFDMIYTKTLFSFLRSLNQTAWILMLEMLNIFRIKISDTAEKMKFFWWKLRTWSHLLKKSSMENFIFVQCGIYKTYPATLIFYLFLSLSSWLSFHSFVRT